MRRVLKWTAGVLGGLVGAIALLVLAMWLSADVRYGVVYWASEHFDLNDPIPPATLARQADALKQADLIGADGKPFDWKKSGHAIVWFNAWANWCVPCRMEFSAMAALRQHVGRDKLRIVLFSQPRFWDADKRTAKELGLDFELVTVKDARGLPAINLSKNNDYLLPEHTFLHADGSGIVAMHEIRDWDSLEWQTVIERWYEVQPRPSAS